MKGFAITAVIVLAALLGYVWWTGKRSNSSSSDSSTGELFLNPLAFDQFFSAIYSFEGPGPRDRNSNPGNLKAKHNGAWDGQIGTDPKGFAIFPDASTGMTALQGYIRGLVSAHPEWDFYDLFSYYLTGDSNSPPSTKEGNSNDYAEFVASQVGVDPTTPVSVAIGG